MKDRKVKQEREAEEKKERKEEIKKSNKAVSNLESPWTLSEPHP